MSDTGLTEIRTKLQHYFVDSGQPIVHRFCANDIGITDQVESAIADIKNITKEDRIIIKLKFGIECLPEGS